MRLLDRYLLRELLAPLAFCLIGIQAFVTVFTVFAESQKIQEHKLHFLETIGYATTSSMDFIPIVLPTSLLLALLITLTYYARHNEITAMRAAGVSLWRICAPYFAVGLAASVALFVLNEMAVPRCTAWADQVLHRYVHDLDANASSKLPLGYYNARAKRLWQFEAFHFNTGEISNPKVNWPLPDGSWRDVMAERAVYTNGVWTFFSKVLETRQDNPTADEIPILATNMLAMPQFNETPKDIAREIRFSKYDSLKSKKLNIPLKELWEYLQANPNLPHAQARVWETKFDGRLAAPWTCVVVVLIAIPFGAASGRRNLFFGVAGSLFICFGFFVIQQTCLAFGSAPNGHLPPWLAAWLPNLIFAATGLVLMARVR